ncbi:alpha/beta fold hydrolase [Pedobacter metabolipauper]|uniref:Pimeloyl-ACP methyl ester carboxylesterase n=1 Tax=Pedobacter metabolipauper TaxID=425513 RepID=A0A4R6SYU8_9SPHI|nr:alpha/beta hydrolase [Pedobacter metabolipauper]TDQ11222.1 pimeloyl-ACP methyl ester carboxylesterase [Pedobacter metabolipauper]
MLKRFNLKIGIPFALFCSAGILLTMGFSGCKMIVNPMVRDYTDPYHRKVKEAGFVEKSVKIAETNLYYVEGPNNGPALLLLHAQLMDWFDYSRVLPELSRSYHIFVVDYNGHGKTTAPASTMNANAIGNILVTFMETEIKEPAFVSGNSSGGLLTTWLAANKPKLVKAILLEDPPLFSSEYPRVKQTIAFNSFTSCHTYVESGNNTDFLTYWIEASRPFIAKYAGDKAAPRLLWMIKTYRDANPGKPVELRFLPDMLRMFFRGLSSFDPHFGDAFYTGEWNRGFDHAEALKKIKCPTLLLQANFEIRPDGILDGAMSKDEAQMAMALLANAEYQKIDASHVVHLDKPEEFIKIMNGFFLNR